MCYTRHRKVLELLCSARGAGDLAWNVMFYVSRFGGICGSSMRKAVLIIAPCGVRSAGQRSHDRWRVRGPCRSRGDDQGRYACGVAGSSGRRIRRGSAGHGPCAVRGRRPTSLTSSPVSMITKSTASTSCCHGTGNAHSAGGRLQSPQARSCIAAICHSKRGSFPMICSSGRSTTSMAMSLGGPRSETGLVRETKWGQTPVSFQAWFVRPSGLCFVEVRVKAKRNGCFRRCHWESLAPRPPEDGYKQEGPVHYQWVRWCNILSGDSFCECSPTKCKFLLTLRQP